MLGHKADERGYEIAGAILRDLRLGSDTSVGGERVRLLTNNPDKMEALGREGVTIAERVPMVPRSWQCQHAAKVVENLESHTLEGGFRPVGATLIGGGAVYGEDLDKYIRTKVLRMGHMLPLTPSGL
jgi:GTP cyclohydrolase II